MKICLISARFYPQLVGSASMAYLIAKKLAERGHDVTVFTDSSLRPDLENLSHIFNIDYINYLEDFATGERDPEIPTEELSRYIYNNMRRSHGDNVIAAETQIHQRAVLDHCVVLAGTVIADSVEIRNAIVSSKIGKLRVTEAHGPDLALAG